MILKTENGNLRACVRFTRARIPSLSALNAENCEEGFLHDRLFAEQLELDASSLKIGIHQRGFGQFSPEECV